MQCPVREIFFGGARGGGKTDGTVGKNLIRSQLYANHYNGIIFRRELPMLDDLIERSKEVYTPIGGDWNEQKKQWRMPGGGRLRFRPLERDSDAEKYQGQNLTDIDIEEVGNYPAPSPIDKLHGALRSAHGVPVQLRMTGNPGGPGQLWIKQRYIDPAPGGMKVFDRRLPSGKTIRSVFIPSKLKDNKILLERDPEYVDRLHAVGSEQLVKAWLEGDWSAIEGAFFDKWSSERNVIRPFAIPKHWTRFVSFDWGYAKPFSVHWHAISDGTLQAFQRGAAITYREWYGMADDQPNVGIRMEDEDIAKGIIKLEAGESIAARMADPSIFGKKAGGKTTAEIFRHNKVHFRPADNNRQNGWAQVRNRILGDDDGPMLFVFDTCAHLIRTLPMMQHDQAKPEDLDTDAEDHACDDLRYFCMSRPWFPASRKDRQKPLPSQLRGSMKLSDLTREAEAAGMDDIIG